MTNQTDLIRDAVALLRSANRNLRANETPALCNDIDAFLAKIDAAEGDESTVPDVTTEDAPSWYNSDMAIAWVVEYEAVQDALAASARNGGA